MVTNRVIPGALGVLIGTLTVSAVWLYSQSRSAAAQQIQTTGYTVVLQEFVIDRHGHERPGSLLTRAVGSDGSVALRLGAAGEGTRVLNLASGVEVRTHDVLLRKSTVRLSSSPASWHRDPESGCLDSLAGSRATNRGEVLDGTVTFRGYRAARVTAGNQTWWFAIDYECAEIGSRMDFGADGSSEIRLVTFTHGIVDPALFQTGPEFRAGPPSEMMPPPGPNCSAECAGRRKLLSDRMDAHYQRHRVEGQ